MNGCLCRLSLLLTVHIWHKRNMYESKVVVPNPKLELPHGFDEGSRFNIPNSSSELRVLEAVFIQGKRSRIPL